jgi:hypothetical protein
MRIRSLPEALAIWNDTEPEYTHLYVVRILDCNPKQMKVKVKRLRAKQYQDSLSQADLDYARQNGAVWSKPSHGGKMDFVFSAEKGKGALVIFHLVDSHASFIDNGNENDTTLSVMKGRGEVNDILFTPKWVGGTIGARKAVSVIMKGGAGDQQYGLGVNVKDKTTGKTTPIFIDPKIENDGDDR